MCDVERLVLWLVVGDVVSVAVQLVVSIAFDQTAWRTRRRACSRSTARPWRASASSSQARAAASDSSSPAASRRAAAPSLLFVHGRSLARAEQAIAELAPDVSGAGACVPVVADLADLRAVAGMAEKLRARPPHVVICSAGVATLPSRTLTADGFEAQFGINHLAHFVLVTSLLPDMPAGSRVVLVSSDLHKTQALLNCADLNSEASYVRVCSVHILWSLCNVFARARARARARVCVCDRRVCGLGCCCARADHRVALNPKP